MVMNWGNWTGETGIPGIPGNQLGGLAGTTGPTDVLSTFAGSPAALWQAARIGALGEKAAIPQFQRTAMQGFNPALGGYMLGGGAGTFADYLNPAGGFTSPTEEQANTNWAAAIEASRQLDPGYTSATPLTAQMATQQGYLQGSDARRNALAMAAAGMGGGVGYGAQARQRALGNLYDLYAARAAAAGSPTGGFLGYLGGIM